MKITAKKRQRRWKVRVGGRPAGNIKWNPVYMSRRRVHQNLYESPFNDATLGLWKASTYIRARDDI